ncbi:MAG: hypothetical protein GY866_24225 [Proteobacteria bacterium]|nr:hypothetical protein [Pseudomonadota bacterium]
MKTTPEKPPLAYEKRNKQASKLWLRKSRISKELGVTVNKELYDEDILDSIKNSAYYIDGFYMV